VPRAGTDPIRVNPDPGTHEPIDPPATILGDASTRNTRPVRLRAALIADAHASHAPGAMILRPQHGEWVIAEVGPERAVPPPPGAGEVEIPDACVVPAFVNAHTHLDLTHIGPRDHDPRSGFVPWVDMIRAGRATDHDAIARSVRLGIGASIRGGVVAVGDIAGAALGRITTTPSRVLAASPLVGVSYLEYFGIGASAPRATERLADFLRDDLLPLRDACEPQGVRIGLAPHATNTIDRSLYMFSVRAARARGLPVTTHAAETPEEREFVAHARGPQREMLERFGIWDETVLDPIGAGASPIAHLEPVLDAAPMLVAHANDADDRDIELLARTGASVVFCPRAHRYFGHASRIGPHRARDMIAAGVRVCVGTDSIVNQDRRDRISPLDELRVLHAQGGWRRDELIALATTRGAGALGLDPVRFTLSRGAAPMGILAFHTGDSRGVGDRADDVWDAAMRADHVPEWVGFNRVDE